MKLQSLYPLIAAVAETDPRGNGLKVGGFDIDMEGAIPHTIKSIAHQLLINRQWSPAAGIAVRSDKPICPVYQGTTKENLAHFKFPAALRISLSERFLIKHVNIKVQEVYVASNLSLVKLIVKTWPDINIKL